MSSKKREDEKERREMLLPPMSSQRPNSRKAGTRRTPDAKTLRQLSEEVAGVHRDQRNPKQRQNLVKTRQTPSDRDTASQEKAEEAQKPIRALQAFATMIREVSRKGRTSDLARDGQGDTTSRNAEETQQQSKLNRAPRTDAMHPKCPPAARQLSGAL